MVRTGGGRMTNREKLNAMSNEELSEFMQQKNVTCNLCVYRDVDYGYRCLATPCAKGYLKWLESEAEP